MQGRCQEKKVAENAFFPLCSVPASCTMSATMKNEMVGYLTIDEMVSVRVALNNSINMLQRVISDYEKNNNQILSFVYQKELQTAKEAKIILNNILKRDN